MMVNFTYTSFLLGFFLVILSIVLFYVGQKMGNSKLGPVNFRTAILVYIVALLGTSLLSTFAGTMYSYEEITMAPCENIISNATFTNVTGANTTFYYINSCYNTTKPQIALTVPIVYGGIIVMTFIPLILFGLFASIYWLGRKW